MTIPGALTPEEAADLPDRVIKALLDNQTRVRALFRRWLIVATLVLGAGVAYNSGQAHQSNLTTSQIRMTQMLNTALSNQRAHCSQVAAGDLAYDLKLIVTPGETPAEFRSQIKIPGTKSGTKC